MKYITVYLNFWTVTIPFLWSSPHAACDHKIAISLNLRCSF